MITPSSADSQCLNTDHNLMEHRVEHKCMSDEGQTITTDTHGFAQTTHTHTSTECRLTSTIWLGVSETSVPVKNNFKIPGMEMMMVSLTKLT